MTPREAASVLAYFTAAWPWATVADQTAEVWAEHLTGVDTQDAHSAARRLVDQLDAPPSIARFLEECRAVKRNRGPQLEPGRQEPYLSRDEALERIRALRRGLKVASELIPDHDHRKGWKQCPACSTADARRPQVEAAIRSELEGAP